MGLRATRTRPGRNKPLSAEVIARCDRDDAARKATGGHAMERAHARQGGWSEPHQRTAHLGGAELSPGGSAHLQLHQPLGGKADHLAQ